MTLAMLYNPRCSFRKCPGLIDMTGSMHRPTSPLISINFLTVNPLDCMSDTYCPNLNARKNRSTLGTLKNVQKKDGCIEQIQLKKFRKVSNTVWVDFEAVIIEKTNKKGMDKEK